MMRIEMKKKKIYIFPLILLMLFFHNLNNFMANNIDFKAKNEKRENTLKTFMPYVFVCATMYNNKNKYGKKKQQHRSFFLNRNTILNNQLVYKNPMNPTNKHNSNCIYKSKEKRTFYTLKEIAQKIDRPFILKSRKCDRYRTTREGKNEMIRKVKRILKVTKLLIQLNAFKITPNLRMELLINLPRPHVRMHLIKNTLMKLAVFNTPFEAITPYLKENNMYLFIMNERYISFTLYQQKLFNSIYKEFKTNNPIKLSVYENTILTKKETEELINLKNKEIYFANTINKLKQLITNIPMSIMQIPTSIARGIYLSTQKKK